MPEHAAAASASNETAQTRVAEERSPPTATPNQSLEPAPLSEEEIAKGRARSESLSEDYSTRIEARRALIYPLCEAGQVEPAMAEFEALLDDVRQQEGDIKAQRVAMNDARTLHGQQHYHAAVAAYEQLLARWPGSHFSDQALFQIGACHLELHEYAEAGTVWQRFIEEFDGSPRAPWGWRRLALAQLLQGEFDTSLATLKLMAAKYEGSEWGYYGQMRQGYVQMVAGRLGEARSTFDKFLEQCGQSKYCKLVRKQLEKLAETELAAATHRREP